MNWTVATNDGTVSPATSVTDATGLAATAWTLGTLAGANEVGVNLDGQGTTTFFDATGTAGPAAILELVSGDGQTANVNATLLGFDSIISPLV